MRSLLSITYAPAMLLGFNALAIFLVENGAAIGWLGLLLAMAIACSFIAEQLVPYEKDWNRDHNDLVRDAIHGAVNELSNAISVLLIPLLTLLTPFYGVWPVEWPLWAQVLMAVVVADAGITLAHYWSHKIDWMWRFHAVHHSVDRLYGFNGLMKHPLHQLIEITVGVSPLIVVGMPQNVGALLGFAVAVQLLLQHSNVDMRIGFLRHVLAIAPLHRFHHVNDSRRGNVNFGLFTTLWDRMLGTAVFESKRRFVSEDIGIEGRPDYPKTYLAQMIQPFRDAKSESAGSSGAS